MKLSRSYITDLNGTATTLSARYLNNHLSAPYELSLENTIALKIKHIQWLGLSFVVIVRFLMFCIG